MAQDDRTNVHRIAAILKSFDAENTPRRTLEIVTELGMSRSTGFGLLRALLVRGWLERSDHGHVRLGPRARSLAHAAFEASAPTAPRRIVADPRRAPDSEATPDLEWDPAVVRMVDAGRYRKQPPHRVGFSNASTSNPWRRAMMQSLSYARKIAQTQIAEMLITDAEDNPERQLTQVNELVDQGIDLLLISIASVNHTALSDRLAALAAEGLPIVAVDRRPKDRSSLVSFVTASDHRIGRISALWMAEHLGGRGRVWMLSGLEGASPALRRQHAALSVFAEFPGIKVENVSYTDWTEQGGADAVTRLLGETGRAPDGVWCDSGLQGVGSVRHFLGLGQPVPAHTGGDINEMYRLCVQERVPMVALDYPASMGARALELSLEVLEGGKIPQRIEVPVQIVLPRGCETASVKADAWAELHAQWDLSGDAILSQGPALRGPQITAKPRMSA